MLSAKEGTDMSDSTPTPPPAPGPVPPPPPAGQLTPAPQNGMGTAALVMGVLQFFILGPLGSILAIVFGAIGMSRAKKGLADNGGVAKAGFWLGIAGILLSVVLLFVLLFTGAFIFQAVNESLDPANNTKTGLADGEYYMEPSSDIRIGDDCSYTGVPYTADTNQPGPSEVTIVGSGSTQCPGAGDGITLRTLSVSFTVADGTASIDSVRSQQLELTEKET
jgi:hypothetical protein